MVNIYMLTYNRAQFIEEAINSILNQEYRDFKLIILNNCSTDNTLEVLAKYKDERISIITHEKNIGGIENANYAIKNNDAKYFMIVHDDDIFEPDAIRTEVEFLDAHPDVAIVSLSANIIDTNGLYVKYNKKETGNYKEYYYSGADYFLNKIHHKGKEIVCPSVMWRGSFAEEHQVRMRSDAGPACDFVQYSEVCFVGGKICVLDAPMINYRVHTGQDSYNNLLCKFEIREADVLYNLNQKYDIGIKNKEFSKYVSRKVAERAYRIAKYGNDKNGIKEAKIAFENKPYFCGYSNFDRMVIFISEKCPWLIKVIAKLRK